MKKILAVTILTLITLSTAHGFGFNSDNKEETYKGPTVVLITPESERFTYPIYRIYKEQDEVIVHTGPNPFQCRIPLKKLDTSYKESRGYTRDQAVNEMVEMLLGVNLKRNSKEPILNTVITCYIEFNSESLGFQVDGNNKFLDAYASFSGVINLDEVGRRVDKIAEREKSEDKNNGVKKLFDSIEKVAIFLYGLGTPNDYLGK